jgi:hypothetical protein
VYRYTTRDITKNYPIDEALTWLAQVLGSSFKNAHLQTTSETVQWQLGKKNKVKFHRQAHQAAEQTAPVTTGHQREKQRYLDQSRPFLTALGGSRITSKKSFQPCRANGNKSISLSRFLVVRLLI